MQGQKHEPRTIEDRLRQEYLGLLPEMRLVCDEMQTEVNHCLLPIKRKLSIHEQIIVTSRIKECEGAIDKLRGQGGIFDPGRASEYSLSGLTDLVGVRVSVFPRTMLAEVTQALHKRFPAWKADPFRDNRIQGEKYCGPSRSSRRIGAEYQVVPLLIGLFWDVEHDAIYKPTSELVEVARSLRMAERTSEVYAALEQFEKEFIALLQEQESFPRPSSDHPR